MQSEINNMQRANVLLQNLASSGKQDAAFLNLCAQLIYKYGASPFHVGENGKTSFETAVNSGNLALINMFVLVWLSVPSWKLHDEIYKLEENKEMLTYINDLVIRYHNTSSIVNHVLNVLHMYLVK